MVLVLVGRRRGEGEGGEEVKVGESERKGEGRGLVRRMQGLKKVYRKGSWCVVILRRRISL